MQQPCLAMFAVGDFQLGGLSWTAPAAAQGKGQLHRLLLGNSQRVQVGQQEGCSRHLHARRPAQPRSQCQALRPPRRGLQSAGCCLGALASAWKAAGRLLWAPACGTALSASPGVHRLPGLSCCYEFCTPQALLWCAQHVKISQRDIRHGHLRSGLQTLRQALPGLLAQSQL